MSEEDRHVNKRSTGTVPKQRNNHSRPFTGVERLRSLSNSSSDCYPSRDSSKEFKIRRSNQFNELIVESTLEDQNFSSPQISYTALNSIGSSHPSSPNSRRNSSSSTLKCDNLRKYPNKKQIEDKLNQIHEYLKVTNSLMESMKKTDEEITGSIDDYSMESAFSCRKNEENANLDNAGYNLGILKERQQMGYPLRRKSENKRCLSSHNQSNLLLEVCNDIHSPLKKDTRNYMEFDTVSKDRSEKLKKPLQSPRTSVVYNQDKGFPNSDSLHNQIMNLHTSHDENERLLDTLDNTDSELAKQHAELHKKLIELQSRKYQIDHLVAQLQSFGDSYDDTDNQYKNISAVKEQLSKLKDMLEVVKLPDNILQNTNHSCDSRKMSCYLCSGRELFCEKDVKNPKFNSRIHNDSNTYINENVTTRDTKPKQLNNSSRDRGNHLKKGNMLSIVQKIALQSELECKKRELVEIMAKHKGNASNLNQDIGIDTKSEISSANGFNEPWTSIISQESDSERFSSDDCQDEVNNYQELKHNFLSLPSLNYSPSSITNYQSENSHRNCEQSNGFQPIIVPTYEPEINFRSNSVGETTCLKRSSRCNAEDPISNQVQEQLQMIKSMCDSMLELQISQEHTSNAQQLRNNLIPSPQRRQALHSQRSNSNTANPSSEALPQSFASNTGNNMSNDIGSYYNWLTNNTIQTQSFVLNTLNQCYQMLWLQQRELATMKSNLLILQERLNSMGPSDKYSPPSLQTNPQVSPNRRMHQTEVDVNKMNQHGSFTVPVPEPFDCSLPNMSLNCLNNNSQLLDSCLNNINANRVNMQQNSAAPNMPTAIGHSLPNHIWSGQALNNQVVPGNRANNYWDNFRSYSRQNLLSSKNNEVLQNLPSVIDRSNFTNQSVDPFTFISFSKSNSEQDSTSTFQENTPHGMATKETGVLSSEILSINNPMRNDDITESPSRDIINKDDSDVYFGLPSHLNDVSAQNSTISATRIFPKSKEPNERIENLTDVSHNSNITSLFEEMRESIYKEVATLISANENRPEFLIQLFRDLQMVDSDNGRYNILQSIGRNITLSRVFTPTVNKNDHISRTFTSQDLKTLSSSSTNTEYVTYTDVCEGVQLFLEEYEDVIIQDEFVTALKRFIFGLESFKLLINDPRFMEHLNQSLITELEKYYGKQLSEVKIELLETTNGIIIEHLGITRCDENFVDIRNSNQEISNSVTTTAGPVEDGDLAEADQSRLINEDIAEEGAVGGILDPTTYTTMNAFEVANLSVSVDLPRSQSTTPTKGMCVITLYDPFLTPLFSDQPSVNSEQL
ncbi:pericentriolar material 1 protein isoform X1 [Diorhabda carinulata]|uniref:pericentriolar material 1 protein isoform X1 n=1 Tax=Diorhabda carinulata TaxID=1163345 RepID=UPI00259FE8FB|nr:pericentriolar material 1 protein isoform X1 [Diorhabda carinulata]